MICSATMWQGWSVDYPTQHLEKIIMAIIKHTLENSFSITHNMRSSKNATEVRLPINENCFT